ncbi:MAG: nitrite/sulfite reductase [Verrucomicrobia bacterium]|nr:nitrite/sulfite reductase [Verrucomicrobiota bacterium]
MIPPEIQKELAELKRLVERHQGGDLKRDEFRTHATHYGVYPQGQEKLYFLRIRVLCGMVSSEQLEELALVAHAWGDGKCHLTTRQGVEIHGVTVENIIPSLTSLASAGLISHESGGSSVRNIVLCPHAGIGPGEPFDVTDYADWLTRHLLRHSDYQKLPRKMKIGMSCCQADCGRTLVQDIGFQARVEKGSGLRGFRVAVGGGLGAHPRMGQILFEFAPADELLLVTDAILRVFDRMGERQNRRRSRLKFFIESAGIESFRRLVEEELARLKSSPPSHPPLLSGISNGKEKRSGSSRFQKAIGQWTPNHQAYLRWRTGHVRSQQQSAWRMIDVRVPAGDFSVEQFKQIALIMRHHGLAARLAPGQTVLLRGARPEQLKEIHHALHTAGLDTLLVPVNLIACPGAAGCPNAFTNTRALIQALRLQIKIHEDFHEDTAELTIRVSGCMNGCSQHAVADIGFEGAARHHNTQWIPSYRVWLGGTADQETVRFGTKIGAVPARKAPALLADLMACYRKHRTGTELFGDTVHRTGVAPFCKLLEKHAASFDLRQKEMVQDWGAGQPYHPPRRAHAGVCG